jgi:hypothetical protein
MEYVGIVGTRDLPIEEIQLIEDIVAYAMNKGYGICSGGAEGVDQLAINEANWIDPKRVLICKPWAKFNKTMEKEGNEVLIYENTKDFYEWTVSVDKFHPNPKALNKYERMLMARNYGIICHSSYIVARPRLGGNNPGGTGQTMRIAKFYNIPVIDLTKNEGMNKIIKSLKINIPSVNFENAKERSEWFKKHSSLYYKHFQGGELGEDYFKRVLL